MCIHCTSRRSKHRSDFTEKFTLKFFGRRSYLFIREKLLSASVTVDIGIALVGKLDLRCIHFILVHLLNYTLFLYVFVKIALQKHVEYKHSKEKTLFSPQVVCA